MRDLLTPKQVARAINVSESSVKRWCDKGAIRTQYTAGGHRRIPLAGLIEFLRGSAHELVAPELVGLPASSGQTPRGIRQALERFTPGLVAGNEPLCRRITLDLFLAEHSISRICDELLAASFQAVGQLWACGQAEVYQERRGCELTLRILRELGTMLAQPEPDAPVAIGATVTGDQYALGTAMAELVLRDGGWSATSLGTNLPCQTLAAAIEQHRPKLFWLSCSHLEDEAVFLRQYNALYDQFGMNVAFVTGGQALHADLRQQMKFAAFCSSMQHLESFAQSLRTAMQS